MESWEGSTIQIEIERPAERDSELWKASGKLGIVRSSARIRIIVAIVRSVPMVMRNCPKCRIGSSNRQAMRRKLYP